MKTVVRVKDLSKTYKLFHGPRALFRELFFGQKTHHPLTALNNVSFKVNAGEAFGIIGNNGAGKSTLLKILTGTAFPTQGKAEVKGRIGALLELGAGFHPEFSGRKNIYFSGAIMGLDLDEIQAREQEIIDFSELHDFIDKPVKTYSSGMYLRLGFSVATGFDTSILIVDEALSVGDQRFQKKCTDRIIDYKRAGNTILLCSHNLHHVRTLCERAIWLHNGSVMAYGPSKETVDQYETYIRGQDTSKTQSIETTPKKVCWIENCRLTNKKGEPANKFLAGDTICLEIKAHFTDQFLGVPAVGVYLCRNDHVVIYTTGSAMEGVHIENLGNNLYRARITFPDCQLLAGQYHFNVCTTDQENLQAYDIVQEAATFVVSNTQPDFGLVRLNHFWD